MDLLYTRVAPAPDVLTREHNSTCTGRGAITDLGLLREHKPQGRRGERSAYCGSTNRTQPRRRQPSRPQRSPGHPMGRRRERSPGHPSGRRRERSPGHPTGRRDERSTQRSPSGPLIAFTASCLPPATVRGMHSASCSRPACIHAGSCIACIQRTALVCMHSASCYRPRQRSVSSYAGK